MLDFPKDGELRLEIPFKEEVANSYDLKTDFRETQPLKNETVLGKLKQTFFELYKKVLSNDGVSEDTEIELDENTVKQLKTLGYIQ